MNTVLVRWFHRVITLFKIYLSAALVAVFLALGYGFLTGPVLRINLPFIGPILGVIVVAVVVMVVVNAARAKAGV